MATPTAIGSRVDHFLHAIWAELDDLPHTLQQWPTREDWQRAEFALEWPHLMADYLADLEEHCQSGAMSEPQRARYRELLVRLQAAMPIIERLDLRRP